MRNYVLIILDVFAQYKQSPQPAVTVLCPPPCTLHPLCSASSDTAQSTVPTSVWHPSPYCPLSSATVHAAVTTHYLCLLPCLHLSPGRKEKEKWEREGKVGKEVKIMLVNWWMDLGNSHMPFTTLLHLYCMHKYFFSVHLLPFIFSALPTPLWGCV